MKRKYFFIFGSIILLAVPITSLIVVNKNSKDNQKAQENRKKIADTSDINAIVQALGTLASKIATSDINAIPIGTTFDQGAAQRLGISLPSDIRDTILTYSHSTINKDGNWVVTINVSKGTGIAGIATITVAISGIDEESRKSNLKFLLNNLVQDGLYLVRGFYKGEIYNAQKQFTNGEEEHEISKKVYEKIPMVSGWGRDQSVIQMAKGDSLIMAYDEDNNDGLKQDNFEDTVAFSDTSIIRGETIYNVNMKIGRVKNIKSEWNAWKHLIMFIKNKVDNGRGRLSPYIGSQSNHLKITWDQGMKILEEELSDEIAIANIVKKYYKKASKFFVPLYMKNSFIYKRIHPRAIKITFIGDKPITAAKFWVAPNGINGKNCLFGTYSLTKQDFKFYENHKNNYFFLGRYAKN